MKRLLDHLCNDPVPFAIRAVIVAVVGVVSFFLLLDAARAEAIASASQGTVTVTLTNEPCKLDAVKNLPYRAEWRDGAKVFQGCFNVWPGGYILAYFDDRTAALIPVQEFRPVGGA